MSAERIDDYEPTKPNEKILDIELPIPPMISYFELREPGVKILGIELPLAPSVNHLYATVSRIINLPNGKVKPVSKRVKSEAGEQYDKQVFKTIRESHPDFEIPLDTDLVIQLVYYVKPVGQKWDIDNRGKATIDSVFAASHPGPDGRLPNDNQIEHISASRIYLPDITEDYVHIWIYTRPGTPARQRAIAKKARLSKTTRQPKED